MNEEQHNIALKSAPQWKLRFRLTIVNYVFAAIWMIALDTPVFSYISFFMGTCLILPELMDGILMLKGHQISSEEHDPTKPKDEE